MAIDNIGVNRRNLTAMIAARGNAQGVTRDVRQTAATAVGAARRGEPNFADVLNQASAPANAPAIAGALKISKHAENRMRDRNINLSDGQREKIALALEKAESRGVRDTLVMLDGFALVANAASRTVITAVGESDLKQNIFTNIDGAVFA